MDLLPEWIEKIGDVTLKVLGLILCYKIWNACDAIQALKRALDGIEQTPSRRHEPEATQSPSPKSPE